MSAIYKALDIVCQGCHGCVMGGKCTRVRDMRRTIAEAQLEAVESFWQEIRPPMPHAQIDRIITVCVYTHTVFKAIEQLRKAAGKGE